MKRLIAGIVLGLALSRPAAADFADGLGAYLRGDFAAAVQAFTPLAEAGDPVVQYLLGGLYALGVPGVERDPVQAYQWLGLAAAQGVASAAELREAVAERMTPEQLVAAAGALVTAVAPLVEVGRGPAEPAPPEMMASLQRCLAAMGYAPGPADGVAGPQTRAAIRAFQHDAGLPPDGRPSRATAASIIAAERSGLIREIQGRLNALGFAAGPVDGRVGPQTRAAMAAYRRGAERDGAAGFEALAVRLAAELDRGPQATLAPASPSPLRQWLRRVREGME